MVSEAEAFFAAHEDIPKIVALGMLLRFKEHLERGDCRYLISTGKLWRARRLCDECGGAMTAGTARHLFRWEAKAFKSFFICADCEDRWEKLGDAGVPHCLPEHASWLKLNPESVGLTHCGDCCIEFTPDNPAKGIAAALRGPICLLCEHCSDCWRNDPHMTPGLAYKVMPLPAKGSWRTQVLSVRNSLKDRKLVEELKFQISCDRECAHCGKLGDKMLMSFPLSEGFLTYSVCLRCGRGFQKLGLPVIESPTPQSLSAAYNWHRYGYGLMGLLQ